MSVDNFIYLFTLVLTLCSTLSRKAFLLYEDQEQELCNSRKCMNFLTLKKKHYEIERSMEDFTVCFRLYLLSYRGKSRVHNIIRARTSKYVRNQEDQQEWMTGFHFELNPREGICTPKFLYFFNTYHLLFQLLTMAWSPSIHSTKTSPRCFIIMDLTLSGPSILIQWMPMSGIHSASVQTSKAEIFFLWRMESPSTIYPNLNCGRLWTKDLIRVLYSRSR